jgi:hypothetical protein
MIGQGRPSSLALPLARAPRRSDRLVRWLLAGLVAIVSVCAIRPVAAQDRLLQQPVRMRIVWGGPEARRWSGRIALAGGTFSDMQLLGMDADAAGSIWIDDGVIHVDAIRAHQFDGIDVTVTAGDAAQLTIELKGDHMTSPATIDVPLAKAVREQFLQKLDAERSQVLVQRSPGDALRIETDRDTLIFAPGEEFEFVLRPILDELEPGTAIDVKTTLSRARGGGALWSDPQRLPVPIDGQVAATIKVPVPNEEGVYTVRVGVSHPPGVRKAFLPIGGSKPLAERTFQIVSLKPAPDDRTGVEDWQPVLEIDPANPRWWQRLPNWTQLRRLPDFGPRPLGSLRAGVVDHSLGQFVELPPTVAGAEPHWQAYVLPIEKTDVPHLLEVEYPADAEQHFGLSILEPNAAGRIVPVGRDSGVYVEGLGRAEQTDRHTHRLVFWPRTNSPMLLVTNFHPSAAARFGRIRVLRAADTLAGSKQRLPWRESQRMVAAYVARPLVPELFGATERLDATNGESVDDWQTYLEGGERLADYLQYAGYNAAVLNVLADGSSIYPSGQLLPTPLHDTGRTVTGAIDLPEADQLELLLRIFDREGLALVPTLQLAAPLPELELLRRAGDPQTSGIEWVDGNGRTWLAVNGTQRGLAPYYNLLDERVQQAVLNVVRELTEQYGHHAAFAGLAVQLSADGYGQLPGLEWGFDDATIAEFEREMGVRLAASGPNRFAARQTVLLGPQHNMWRQWRATRITRFYSELAECIQAAGPERRLLLTTEEMFTTPQLKAQLHPNILRIKSRLDQLMLDVGIDRAQLEQSPGLAFCSARFVAPTSPLVDRSTDLEINEALVGGRESRVAMFFHRPERVRLATFDAKSGLNAFTLLVAQSSADTAAVRKPLAELLSQSDPTLLVSGGELLPMGQEVATRDVLRVLQQLPARAQVTVHRGQPVVVRTYAAASGTTYLVINECPWSVDAEVALDLPADAELEVLCGGAKTQAFLAGQQTWSLKLEPYGICAARMSAAGVKVAAVRATVSGAAKEELAARLADLTDRDLTAPSKYAKLANAGFEPADGGEPLPGWQLIGDAATAAAKLDTTARMVGVSSLMLQNRGATAAVESNTFATPPTGQLAMAVWVRGGKIDSTTELRMMFEADRAGQPYRTYATLGGNRPGAQPLGNEWRYLAFGVNDVPLDSRGQMRVRFELVGAGEVWIDDVQLYDVLFPLPFYQYESQEKIQFVKLQHAAKSAYEKGQIADSMHILEGYWSRFLMEYTPLVQPAVVQPVLAGQPPPAGAPAAAPPQQPNEPPPNVGWKRWVPNWLR